MTRQRCIFIRWFCLCVKKWKTFLPRFHRRSKTELTEDQADSGKSTAEQLFEQCERTKEKLVSPTANQSAIWLYRQEFLDKYQQLVLFDLDFAIEKKLEQDLWTIIFKNDMTQKQEQLKIHQNNQIKRTEIQTSLQILYEYARGFYLKLLQVGNKTINFLRSEFQRRKTKFGERFVFSARISIFDEYKVKKLRHVSYLLSRLGTRLD